MREPPRATSLLTLCPRLLLQTPGGRAILSRSAERSTQACQVAQPGNIDAGSVCRLTFSGNAHAMVCLSSMRTPMRLLIGVWRRYDAVMEAFGGDGFTARSAAELAAACRISFAARRPALINVAIDPFAGVESGNVHAFNQPSKL